MTPLHVMAALLAADDSLGASICRATGFQNLDTLREAVTSEMRKLPRQQPPPPNPYFDSAMESVLHGAAASAKKKGDSYLAAYVPTFTSHLPCD